MKKNTLKSAFAALAVSAVALSGSAMTAFAGPAAGQAYNAGNLDPSKSAIKPTLTVSKETIKLDEAKANPTRDVTITVKGAADKYAPTGLHIQFDSRLKVVTKTVGGKVIYAKLGEAGEYLSQEQQGDGDNGFFVATAASEDVGQDGVLWKFQLTLPSDVKGGDKFPIEIAYKSKPTAEDLFTNGDKDEAGQLMQAYVFTQGIEQGYIAIEGTTTTSTTTTTTTTTTTSKTTTSTTSTTTSSTSTSTGSTTTTTAGSSSSTSTTTKKGTAKTTAKPTTTKAKTTGKKQDSAKTGVAGAGVAVAGLAIAVGTAFAFRKKED